MKIFILSISIFLLSPFLFSACTKISPDTIPASETPDSVTETTNSISISNFAFTPANLKITAGEEVTFMHEDSVTHNIVSTNGTFTSQNMERGDSFTQIFSEPGTYEYYCGIHPSMRGTITVNFPDL